MVRGKICVAEDRPGTGDSSQVSPVKDPRPLWLQHDDKPRAPLASREPEPPERRGEGVEAAADPRKVKRLQQEIQRLSQRLAESEMYSAGLPKSCVRVSISSL